MGENTLPTAYDTQGGGYDADGNYYLYDDMGVCHE